ncbi:unnamed protein product, partial [Rotaria sordida]
LAEFLGEDVIKDKGLCCRFVIANVPRDTPVTERAIPLAIFQSEQSIRNHYLPEHLHTHPWQIISYELTDQIGIFKAWCLVEHELIQIKIKVPRIVYVNYRTSIENNNIQAQHSIGYEHTINNCSKRVNRLLPRCSQIYYLYEYRLDENHFRDYYTDIMTDLSNPNIEGVYEMNLPLDFRLLITLGCICSLRKEQQRTNILS